MAISRNSGTNFTEEAGLLQRRLRTQPHLPKTHKICRKPKNQTKLSKGSYSRCRLVDYGMIFFVTRQRMTTYKEDQEIAFNTFIRVETLAKAIEVMNAPEIQNRKR